MRGPLGISGVVGLVAALLVSLSACGGEHEESFSKYGECYEHLRAEGRTVSGAFMECDESFSPTYTDNAMCVAYYDDFSQIPMDAITMYCDGMSF